MRPGKLASFAFLILISGCYFDPAPRPYGVEQALQMPGHHLEVWAVAPAINLSGQRQVDPLLQADLVFAQLQQVRGITAIPVNRVAQVYAGLEIKQIENARQATVICDLLGADAILIPTVTAYDPYSPPKMAASLALFHRPHPTAQPAAAQSNAAHTAANAEPADLFQAVGIFDSEDGSVRAQMLEFAAGRSDPNGPMAEREFFLSMDAYSGFVYHSLIADLLGIPREPSSSSDAHGHSGR